jgi:anti-sigma B factor antagonist
VTTPQTHRDDLDDLDVHVITGPRGWTMTVTGDLDAGAADHLSELVAELLGRLDVTAVELDLSGVTFLGAAGLTALVTAHQTAQRTSRTLTIRCGSGRAVLRPLQITGLSTVLDVVDR